jgi:hypothetical protein
LASRMRSCAVLVWKNEDDEDEEDADEEAKKVV